MRKRRDIDTFSLSFLDAICCGFGAIVLLLVLSKIGEPRAIEDARSDLDGLIVRLEEELEVIRDETAVLERRMRTKVEEISDEEALIARLRGDLSAIQGEYAASKQFSEVDDILEGRLLAAQQQLTEEMKRLQQQSVAPASPDPRSSAAFRSTASTSSSSSTPPARCRATRGRGVRRKMEQVLDAYPKVKGMQVMNDMGQYMFSYYAGKWIPDTPARRNAVLQNLATWNVFSNSSPVEGITRAIRTFATPEKKVSIYVFGDEFTGNSIDAVIRSVDRINKADKDGNRLVRIHAIGFPTIFASSSFGNYTGVRFATLMRILCHRNGGTFVALNSV